MNPWPFVIAAYSVTLVATAGLVVLSFLAMRKAEADVEALRRP
ncbi:heme exporter protein CcmD [Sphingomicrobium clamense]|uniref:Heme exporter protein D n=1 Tax=Sphingomicrobium clamense TaxID=2851013 RepID=A0ABS6V6X3_9SPHN|nr:heme exporter protein CcmD [Sphingomicrobium sp. B8]MBW0145241.1 heme exporter protein CcmD [Sphingomicrobium sp. B8]